MNRVHENATEAHKRISSAAIAITALTPTQNHLGILHVDQRGQSRSVQMLHLRWHFRLSNSLPEPNYNWVDPDIHPLRLRQVAAMCRRILNANADNKIPYAFSEPGECFDPKTYQYLVGESNLGLTCATFVLAVFHATGLQLADYDSWPVDRDGDNEWQQEMIETLIEHGADDDHVDGVKSQVGAKRYRPEEVAGAGTSDVIPATFVVAEERGRQILNALRVRL